MNLAQQDLADLPQALYTAAHQFLGRQQWIILNAVSSILMET